MLKKILAFLICFNMSYLPAHCIIQDDFAEKALNKNAKIKEAQKPKINDDFAENNLSKNYKIKEIKNEIIEDKFAENNKNRGYYHKLNIDFNEQVVPFKNEVMIAKKADILTSQNTTPVKIRIKKYLSTRHKVDEGDYIEFETLSEVKIKDKIYPKGTKVKARIETISQNKIWGVPSDLVVGNFTIDGKPLQGEINKTGANRSLWLYPTIYMTSFCFGFGLLLVPIRGGHAKIRPSQIYTVNYFE